MATFLEGAVAEHEPELVDFAWRVPEGGFQVVPQLRADARDLSVGVPHRDHAGPFIAERAAENEEQTFSVYAPLTTCSGLYRTFIHLDLDPAAIAAFASRYGLLGFVPRPVRLADGDSERYLAEHVLDWIAEIRRLRRAVELWEWASAGDVPQLRQCIAWRGGARVHVTAACDREIGRPGETPHVIADRARNPDTLALFEPGDVVRPAQFVAQHLVNRMLREHATYGGVLWDDSYTTLGLHIMPRTLLGAMWVQFAQDLDSDRRYRKCAECHTWFAISLDTHRKSRRYCSDACRAKSYRQRREEREQS